MGFSCSYKAIGTKSKPAKTQSRGTRFSEYFRILSKLEISKLYLLLNLRRRLLMIGFVFDANVPWDLDKIGKLDQIMQALENINFKIYISDINYNEIPVRVRNKLGKYQNFAIDDLDNAELDTFIKEIRQSGVILDSKDSAVLFTSGKVDADYIVSSDTRVQLMTKKYAENHGKKARPFHLIDLLSFLHKVNLIESNLCIKMALSLYKNKEIPHMVETQGKELINNITQRNAWIKKEVQLSVNTFNNYEKHIVSHIS